MNLTTPPIATKKPSTTIHHGIAVTDDYAWLRDALLENDGARLKSVRALAPIADDLNIPMSRLALAWCLRNPNVSTVILGASKASQLEENLKALDAVPLLNDETMRRIGASVSG